MPAISRIAGSVLSGSLTDRHRKTRLRTSGAWLVLGLASSSGCSGSNTMTGIQSELAATVTRGIVTDSAQLTVSGREYSTESASVSANGKPGTLSTLAPGMKVTIEGNDGVANTVTYVPTVLGPLEFVNLDGTLSVMGQTIVLDVSTRLGNIASGTYRVGDVLEVSGLRDSAHHVLATYIERKERHDAYHISGSVKNLNVDAMTFNVQNLLVNFRDATLVNVPVSGITEGMYLELDDQSATYEPGSLVLAATELRLTSTDSLSGNPDAEYEIDDLVTTISGEDIFSIGMNVVKLSDSTSFRNGSRQDLDVDSRIEVEGFLNENTILLASEIEFHDGSGSTEFHDFDPDDDAATPLEAGETDDNEEIPAGGGSDVDDTVEPENAVDPGTDAAPGVDTDVLGDMGSEPDSGGGAGSDVDTADAQSGGCDDAYDDNGASPDNLSSPTLLSSSTARINRSLCGFYNADYTEFPARTNASYRIEVLNHQSPQQFGVYIQLLERGEDGNLRLVEQTPAGSVALDFTTTNSALNHVVRVSSTTSETGRYGGGNYTLSISIN